MSKRLREAGVAPSSQDGKTLWFVPRVALAAIYETEDPQAERKRLDGVRADLGELELAKKRGELVPAPEVEIAWVAVVSAVRTRVLAVPAAVAQELATASKPAECHGIVEAALYEALSDLADTPVKSPPPSEDPGA